MPKLVETCWMFMLTKKLYVSPCWMFMLVPCLEVYRVKKNEVKVICYYVHHDIITVITIVVIHQLPKSNENDSTLIILQNFQFLTIMI